MALFKKEEFTELAKVRDKFCISVYIPTLRAPENKKSKIQLKNRIAKIEKQLSGFGLKQRETDEFLQPLKEVLNDTSVWRHMSDALMLFRTSDNFWSYTLPLQVNEFSLISDRLHLLPLLAIFNRNDSFFILTLSLNKNRLFEATQHEIAEIETKGILPEDISDAVGRDVKQKSRQFRSNQTSGGYALYHGKGEGKEDKKKEIVKYLEEIDAGLKSLIEGYKTPLVVASVESLCSQFRMFSEYNNIYPECISGNHDNTDMFLLHEMAKESLQPYFDRKRNEMKNKYHESVNQSSSDIGEVVVSADSGRVDTLFVERESHVWGSYNPTTAGVNIHEDKKPMDSCLIDFAARKVFLQGGKVFIEEHENLPEENVPVNAILRF